MTFYIQYFKDSYVYSKNELIKIWPNPVPALVFLGAIFTTVSMANRCLKGKKFFTFQNLTILLGSWAGHHAVLIQLMFNENKKVVENLRSLLKESGEEVKKYERIAEEQTQEVKRLEQCLLEGGKVVQLVNEGIKGHVENQANRSKIQQRHERNLQEEQALVQKIGNLKEELSRLIEEVQAAEKRKSTLKEEMQQLLEMEEKVLGQLEKFLPQEQQ